MGRGKTKSVSFTGRKYNFISSILTVLPENTVIYGLTLDLDSRTGCEGVNFLFDTRQCPQRKVLRSSTRS